METYLHGIEFKEVASATPPVRGVPASVVGLVGTAAAGPVNAATLVRSGAAGRASFGASGGTIPEALDALFGHHPAAAPVVAVNVFDPVGTAGHRTAVAEADVQLADSQTTLAHTPVVRGTVTVKSSDGNTTYVEGTHYTVDYAAGVVELVDGSGLAANVTLKIGYAHPNEAGVTAADIAGAVDAATGARGGVELLLAAESQLEVKPKLLIAPGYSHQAAAAAKLQAAADKLFAVAIVDGPGSTVAAAVALRNTITSRRAYIVDPGVRVQLADGSMVNRPASAYAAAAIVASDADSRRGWWVSPTNAVVRGIVGTARAVDFSVSDPNAQSNVLNASDVATIVYADGAYRLWGDRGCATGEERADFTFLSAARIGDAIREALIRSHLWAVSRNITVTYLEDVAAGVNDYLAELVGLGALLGGECEPSGEHNTAAQIRMGNATWNIDYHAALPGERLTFQVRINDEYVAAITGEAG